MPNIPFRIDGRTLVVEQPDEEIGYDQSVSASQSPQGSVASLTEVAQKTLSVIADAFTPATSGQPDELTVEFAIRLHHRDGAVLSTDDARSHFKVTCAWTRRH
jgi:Trypsin-co-occurring domain 1